MSLRESIRNEVKLDSRRFGKSTVCKIVYGPMLDYLYQKSLVPPGIYITSTTGLDPMSNKMIVIPSVKFPEIEKLFYAKASISAPEDSTDLDIIENIVKADTYLVDVLKQNIILVTISQPKPKGLEAGPNPKEFDIVIDSIDVNQSMEGTYVYTSVPNIRSTKRWDA